MENYRRILLLIVFATSLGMIWDGWVNRNRPRIAPSTQVASNTGVPQGGVTPKGTTPQGTVPTASEATVQNKAPTLTINTDLVEAKISADGGSIVYLTLKKHKQRDEKHKDFVLLDDGTNHFYTLQSGLLGQDLPTHKTRFNLPAENLSLEEGKQSLEVRLTANNARAGVTKILTFHRNSYLIDVRYELNNKGTEPIQPEAYFQFVRDDKPAEIAEGFGGITTFTGPAFYTNASKYAKVAFKDIQNNKAKIPETANDGWVAMVQHYFVSAILPPANVTRKFVADTVSPGLYSAGVVLPGQSIAPGQSGTVAESSVFSGPQEQATLDALATGMPLVVDYGWLTVIASPLFLAISWLHKLTGNWGWAIILVTILLKLIFFPLSAASYRSMAKMRTLQPKMQQLKERIGDDKMKMQQEMMELYKKEKINPLGGCWPILIQIPIFIALYWVLLGSVEMRQAPWIGWIQDLSIKDPYYVLPLIYGASMFIQTKLNPTPPDPVQAKVMLFMPLIFTVMFLWFPSGLVLYWVVNNVLSIAQQWYITRMIEDAEKAKAPHA